MDFQVGMGMILPFGTPSCGKESGPRVYWSSSGAAWRGLRVKLRLRRASGRRDRSGRMVNGERFFVGFLFRKLLVWCGFCVVVVRGGWGGVVGCFGRWGIGLGGFGVG